MDGASVSGFVLDFDGTLSRIVEQPAGASPVEGARELLVKLSSRYAAVALLSGRRASDLASIVGAEGVRYLGIYGAEEFRGGQTWQPPEAESWRGMASRLARDAESFLFAEGLEGCEVEFKDLAVSVHFRGSRHRNAGKMIASWAESAAPRRRFEATQGRMVVELRPQGVSKANALERVVGEARLGFLVAAGDDTADVEALERAKTLLGDRALTIGVSSDETPPGLEDASDMVVSSPSDLVKLLAELL